LSRLNTRRTRKNFQAEGETPSRLGYRGDRVSVKLSTAIFVGLIQASQNRFCVRTVSHPPKPRLNTTILRGRINAQLCCAKSLTGSALVGFGVRQHVRTESISKRAPSTTRTSLPDESITYSRPRLVIMAIVISPPMCRDHLRAFQYSRRREIELIDITNRPWSLCVLAQTEHLAISRT
jgi:hypothetical protein